MTERQAGEKWLIGGVGVGIALLVCRGPVPICNAHPQERLSMLLPITLAFFSSLTRTVAYSVATTEFVK
jgi:hypothetical protein